MLRKTLAVLFSALAVTAAVCASDCHNPQHDNIIYRATPSFAKLGAPVYKVEEVPVVSQAVITKSTHTGSSIRIYWGKTEGANGYDILRQNPYDITKWEHIARITDNGFKGYSVYTYNDALKRFELKEIVSDKTKFSYSDDFCLSSGTFYTYKVNAFADVNGKKTYGPESAPLSDATCPHAPNITEFTHTTNSVQIFWDKIDCASGYEVFKYNTETQKWDKVKTIEDNTTFSYSEEGLSSGTVYKYKVRAYISFAGITVHGISSAEFAVATNPVASTITNHVQNVDILNLYWEKVQCSGYYIQQYKNGEWVTAATVASPDSNSTSLAGLTANIQLDFRIIPYVQVGSSVIEGAASETFSLVMEYLVAAKSGSVMKYSPAWASGTIMGFDRGAVFHVLETSGNWFKVDYNGTIGYIYNKAVTGMPNYYSITTDTLPVVADDCLFDNGTSISAIFNYCKGMYYAVTPKLSIEEMAARAFKYRSGACYYYASLMYYLLNRAGYEVYIIQGESDPDNEHWWNLVKTPEGWRHFDATPFHDHDYLYGATDEETAEYMSKWDKSLYPAVN